MRQDTYKTITTPTPEVLFKEKNSKFFCYAYPVTTEEEIKGHLEALRKQHHGAVHWCYAFQLGTTTKYHRANDDGEPSGTAGLPIYGQIQSFDLTNVLVVVVRFFGGIKLGVGGLIQAYREGARLALTEAEIVEHTIDAHYELEFDYAQMNKVMRLVKERNLRIVSQQMDMRCKLTVAIRLSEATATEKALENLYDIPWKKQD